MYYRFDLTDAQWEKIQGFFPDRYHQGGQGHPWKDHRPLVNGILWHLHTGAPWPDTPRRYGPWQTIYDRFNRWRLDGTWAKILDALLLELDQAGILERDLWCFDGTIDRAHTSAAGAKKIPRSRRSWADLRRRNCKSRRTMRWGGRGVASAPRSTSSATAKASCWPCGSRQARPTRPKASRRS